MKKFIAPLLITLFFVSCDLNNVNDLVQDEVISDKTLEALTEYVTVNKVFQDVGNNSGDAVLTAENSTSGKSANAKADEPVITVEPMDLTTFPKTTTIDYGTGILCKDGITRKGIVTIVSTNWYGQEGSEHTTTFTDFYHEDYKVEGTHYVKNLGVNIDNNLEYSVIIENGKITSSSGATISFSETATRTWVAGSNTPLNIWDDEYMLEGTQSGMSSKGVSYSMTTQEALHVILLPRGIESGILNITIGDIEDIILNYTNSTLTILGKTIPFIF